MSDLGTGREKKLCLCDLDEVISHKLVKGNNTDLKNNPGRYFDPSRELAIRDPQDVFIEPPTALLLPALAKLSGT